MAKANRYYTRTQAGFALLLTVVLVIVFRDRNEKIKGQVEKIHQNAIALVDQLHGADTAAVQGIVEKMVDARESVKLPLRDRYKRIPGGTKPKFNVTLALVALDPDQSELVADLFHQLPKAEPDQLLMAKKVLDHYKSN